MGDGRFHQTKHAVLNRVRHAIVTQIRKVNSTFFSMLPQPRCCFGIEKKNIYCFTTTIDQSWSDVDVVSSSGGLRAPNRWCMFGKCRWSNVLLGHIVVVLSCRRSLHSTVKHCISVTRNTMNILRLPIGIHTNLCLFSVCVDALHSPRLSAFVCSSISISTKTLGRNGVRTKYDSKRW